MQQQWKSEMANSKRKLSGIIWKSRTEHVDIDTGEEITRHRAETEYIHIKTDKHVTINELKTQGFVTYTKQYTKSGKQRELF